MLEFLWENIQTSITILITTLVLGLFFILVGGSLYIKDANKKRAAKGMAAFTSNEEQVALRAHRFGALVVTISIVFSYAISLLTNYLIFEVIRAS